MRTPSLKDAAGPAPAAPGAEAFHAHLGAVYGLCLNSRHLFASPLGPLYIGYRHAYLPRFVFFGPHASDESWRLAFFAGFDRRDSRASHALLALVEHLAREAETGHGLHLTFFPMVDAAGIFLDTPNRGLATRHWGRTHTPELVLLEKDARLRSYHGFIRVETAFTGVETAFIGVRGRMPDQLLPDLEQLGTEGAETFPVRFENRAGDKNPVAGPLSAAEDLPFTPFELTLRLPSSWSDERYQRAAVVLLQRFLWRYRAFQAYGQHL